LWAEKGKIGFIKTSGGHRRYEIKSPSYHTKTVDTRVSVIYARVSSNKQKSSLKNQIVTLKKKYPKHRLITDIGSGINFKRKGFETILELLLDNNLKEVVVTHYDRLARVGEDLFDWLFEKYGAKIMVINTPKEQSDEQELAEDIIAITTIFTARYHGKRGSKIHKENKVLSNKRTKKAVK
jgi:predicted site-specific integrase-resolvase